MKDRVFFLGCKTQYTLHAIVIVLVMGSGNVEMDIIRVTGVTNQLEVKLY